MPGHELVDVATRAPGRPRDAALDPCIVDAATEELADQGFVRFSVESVAARAHVSKATVYRRFTTRSSLIEAVLVRLNDEITTPPIHKGTREQLIELLGQIRRSAPDSATFRIIRHAAALPREGSALGAMVHEVLIDPRRERLRQCLRRGVDVGDLRRDIDIDAVVLLLVGAVVHLGVWSGHTREEDPSVDALVDLAFAGLAP